MLKKRVVCVVSTTRMDISGYGTMSGALLGVFAHHSLIKE